MHEFDVRNYTGSGRAEFLRHVGLYGITAERLSKGRSNLEVVQQMLDAGIRVIQYREKEKSGREKYEQCICLRKMTAKSHACFIIDDDVALAAACDADGVHIGQDDLPIEKARALLGNKIIGLSTHSPKQAQDAVRRGADYIGVGPLFETHTKADVCAPVGLAYLDYVIQNIPLPFVAIGGIKEHNIAEVARHGASCICLVSDLVGAENISAKVHALRSAMDAACANGKGTVK
jgi:thiamine-phosphate pyrophosphorylase